MLLHCLLSIVLLHSCSCQKYLELSYDLHNKSAIWPGQGVPYGQDILFKGYHKAGFWLESYAVEFPEHISSHIDAPAHFIEGAWTVDQIPLENLVDCPGVLIDISEKVKVNSTAELTTDDLEDWIQRNGPLVNGTVIFIYTGWSSRYGKQKEYFGIQEGDTGDNLISKKKFPGLSKEAAQMIVDYKNKTGNKIVGVGIDVASIDPGVSQTFPAHTILLGDNTYILENAAYLDKLPYNRFKVTVLPIKFRGGSGGPARIIATLY